MKDTRNRILEMIDALKAAVFSDKDLKNSVLLIFKGQFLTYGERQEAKNLQKFPSSAYWRMM
jgi:hypothetical protein